MRTFFTGVLAGLWAVRAPSPTATHVGVLSVSRIACGQHVADAFAGRIDCRLIAAAGGHRAQYSKPAGLVS